MSLAVWDDLLRMEQVAARRTLPARTARTEALPGGLDRRLEAALRAAGIERLYSHQAAAYAASAAGDTVVVTATASGKSLAFNLPVLQTVATDRRARALYLYPTKALAQDQARALALLHAPELRLAVYDGDTPPGERRQARDWANVVLTNPDMLHAGILPRHSAWAELLANLRFVVVDEAHAYRGVFGSHVANVLARLRRVAAHHGSAPRFLLASATVANPGDAAERLCGGPVAVVDDDGSAAAESEIAIWNPPLLDPALGLRVSTLGEAATLFAGLVARGLRTIAFAKTRRGCELLYRYAREGLDRHAPQAACRIATYRAGYTPEQRRQIERDLVDGTLVGVIATSALELGVDIGHLDAAVSVGFPGSTASLRQQWGRAGRRRAGLGILVAGEDALDQYFATNPDALFERPVEAVICNPGNRAIRTAHLLAAAAELPLSSADERHFGADGMQLAESLPQLSRTAAGLVYRGADNPAGGISLRSSSRTGVAVVDTSNGTLLGTVDELRAEPTVHAGAVYMHQGENYLVTTLDLDARVALVEPFSGDFYTQPRRRSATSITDPPAGAERLGVPVFLGPIEVRERVVGYQRKRLVDHRVIDTVELDLPERTFATEAAWFCPRPVAHHDLLGSLHAAEHAMISLLPLLATCDRGDIGGLSTDLHPQTGEPTIFVYDGHPGGVGISARGHELFEDWVARTARLLADCPCERGCPSCIQSPKCGNLNEPLSKPGALALLRVMLAA